MTTLTLIKILSSCKEFFKVYWKAVLIFSLSISLLSSYNTIGNKNDEIALIKLKHEASVLAIKNEHQRKLIELKDVVIESNARVNEVVNDYHEAIKEQDKRTDSYKELQTIIPSVIRESCDFGSQWMLKTNAFIQSSNTNSNNSK